MRQPWICPKCNTAYAPWIDSCACQGVAVPQPIVWDKPITIKDFNPRLNDTTILQPWDNAADKTYNSYIGVDGQLYIYS